MSKNKIYLFADGKQVAVGDGKISFENCKLLQERLQKVNTIIANRVEHEAIAEGKATVGDSSLVDALNKALIKKLNKAALDLAESQGVSIWDICLSYVPELDKAKFVADGPNATYEQTLRLIPLPIDFEQKEDDPPFNDPKYLEGFDTGREVQKIFDEHPKEEPVSEIDFEQELYKYFGQVKDFTLGMRIAKRFYEIGRNYQKPVSED